MRQIALWRQRMPHPSGHHGHRAYQPLALTSPLKPRRLIGFLGLSEEVAKRLVLPRFDVLKDAGAQCARWGFYTDKGSEVVDQTFLVRQRQLVTDEQRRPPYRKDQAGIDGDARSGLVKRESVGSTLAFVVALQLTTSGRDWIAVHGDVVGVTETTAELSQVPTSCWVLPTPDISLSIALLDRLLQGRQWRGVEPAVLIGPTQLSAT